MTSEEKQIIKQHLDRAYELLSKLEGSKTRGSIEYKTIFELENINIKLNIPFKD